MLIEKLHKEVSQGDLASELGRKSKENGHTAKHSLAEKQVWSWMLHSGLTPGDGSQVTWLRRLRAGVALWLKPVVNDTDKLRQESLMDLFPDTIWE